MEKEPFTQFYGHFDHFNGYFDDFSLTYEVAKFCTIRLYLDVSDVIHANEHT